MWCDRKNKTNLQNQNIESELVALIVHIPVHNGSESKRNKKKNNKNTEKNTHRVFARDIIWV